MHTEVRLGDDVDDYCIKCRRITNHAVVSVVNNEAAKVRCRTCYHDHDFRHEIAPPTKKELKAAELLNAALAAAANGTSEDGVEVEEHEPEVELETKPNEAKKA